MKRFTATEKWGKEWFQNLPPISKCLWFYLIENCDCAGIWEGNWRLASFQIGADLAASALEAFGGRVEALDGGKVWLVGFVAFQYGMLSPECKPHIPVIRSLEKHGLLQRVYEGYNTISIPYTKGINTLQDKDKDQGKDQSEGGQGETDAKAEKRRLLRDSGLRIAALFSRKPETKWSEKERIALGKLYPISDDDLSLVEQFYTAKIPKDQDFRRHDLCTLLNNWSGEVDRARKFLASAPKNGANGHSDHATLRPFVAGIDETHFLEWYYRTFPNGIEGQTLLTANVGAINKYREAHP